MFNHILAQRTRETRSEDEGHRYYVCLFYLLLANLKVPVAQSIKEVLQTLVDDGHVQTDKIGSSNCALFLITDVIMHEVQEFQSFGAFRPDKEHWLVYPIRTRGTESLKPCFLDESRAGGCERCSEDIPNTAHRVTGND
jgi:hypothetical protein